VAGVSVRGQIVGMQLVDTGEIPGDQGSASQRNFLAKTHDIPNFGVKKQHLEYRHEGIPTNSYKVADRILHFVARCRLWFESLLKGWALPGTAFTLVLGLMVFGLVRAFEPGRSLQEAGSMIGIFTFGGTFLLATLGVGMWLGRWPDQTREELLLDLTRTRQSRWKTALLAETEIWIEKRTAKLNARNTRRTARAECPLTLGEEETSANNAEAAEC